PGMHTTRTIDYAIVLSGEIYQKLDDGEMRLEAGDIVVQRATRHGWYNRGNKPCPIAFVLISSPNYQ
ncbi:MAG: cupin domain-containing protein, partial [Dehalococcoidia bacterium]|nr:cupin domain-containing protein [Dehalococcoidia bacterium]